MANEIPADQYRGAVLRLIEMTQKGELEWIATQPTKAQLGIDDDFVLDVAFEAEYDGSRLRISRIKPAAGRNFSDYVSTYLEVVDQRGSILWPFPSNLPLRDLLSAVTFKLAGIEDLLKSLNKPRG